MSDDVSEKPAEPILIAEFEGDYVRDFEGKLPALTIAMPEGYARGTHLKLMLEVRIRNVRYEEKRAKNDERPELVRQHMFALEEVQLMGAYTPEALDPGVGGTASASTVDLDEDPDQLTIEEAIEDALREQQGEEKPIHPAAVFEEAFRRPEWVKSEEEVSTAPWVSDF